MEDQKHKRRWLYVAVVLVLALNLVIMVWRRQSSTQIPTGAHQELIDEQTNRLESWLSDRSIPCIDRTAWVTAVRSMPYGNCLDLPDHVTSENRREISTDQLDDLFDAVVGLLAVYVEDSPELLISFMAEHGEVPRPKSVEVLRGIVAEIRGVPISSIQSLRPENVLVAFWKESQTVSHWSGILERSGCYQLWRCPEIPTDEIRGSLGARDRKVFQNISNVVHQFEPVRTLASTFEAEGSLLFADVKVVIQLSPELYSEPVPYFFRFWYDSVDEVWHPYQMGYVDVKSESGAPKHLF